MVDLCAADCTQEALGDFRIRLVSFRRIDLFHGVFCFSGADRRAFVENRRDEIRAA